MIQARPQLVDDLPRDYGEAHRRFWPFYSQDALSGITIGLADESIDVATDQGVDFRIEILDMFIGPLNLGKNTVEWMHDLHLQQEYR
jgi:hypothetical protein